MSNLQEKLKPYAPFCLRIGLAAVFLLFGLQKMYAPGQGSAEIQGILGIGLGLASAMNFYIGLLELALAVSLTLGWMIKYSAPISTLLVLGIYGLIVLKYGASFDPTFSRDLGIIGACFALSFLGAGAWSVDEWLAKRITHNS